MNDETKSFWQAHLSTSDGPLFHFVPSSFCDIRLLDLTVQEIDFAFFLLQAKGITSERALMNAVATSMNAPPLNISNWNVVLDVTRDLSWSNSNGYVLTIDDGNNLPSLPDGAFSSFIAILEATVRDWRDERGEFAERTGPVPFHVVFCGNEALKRSLLNELKEPFCGHEVGSSIQVFGSPGTLKSTASYQDAEKLACSGADPELVLSFLREHGMDERDSIYSIAGLFGKSIPAAKSLIYMSKTWSELRNRDEQRRKIASDALEDAGWDDD